MIVNNADRQTLAPYTMLSVPTTLVIREMLPCLPLDGAVDE